MKTYSAASQEVERCIQKMQNLHHADLKEVTIGALFIYADEGSEPVLKHAGYPAAAVVRITPLRDRALGMPDAIIVIDRASWLLLKTETCEALVDHELTHLERVIDEDTNRPVFDCLNRPKLTMRKHDRQFGWFDEVAERHGHHSMEVRQAKSLLAETSQLYFDFTQKSEAA